MVKLTSFEIQLGEASGVYHAGQTLTGKVKIDLKEPMKMRAIHLWISGRARAHQTGARGGGHAAEEVYLDHKLLVFGDGECPSMHPAGTSQYDFSLPLPDSLPSSMEAKVGHVRFFCKATIDKPWKFNHETKKAFTVLSALDLNNESRDFMNPDEGLASTPMRCFFCVRGECKAVFRINKRAFVPGEPILIYAQVENNSNTAVKGSRAFVEQYTDFHEVVDESNPDKAVKAKRVSCVVASKERVKIRAGQTDVWDNEKMVIPPLPPSRLTGCGIIDISYVIKFHVRVPHGNDLKVTTDFLVGTVPLHRLYPALPPPEAPDLPVEASDLPISIPSPAYRETLTGSVSIVEQGESKYMRGEKEFTPKYIYYNWSQASSHGSSN